MTRLLLFFCFSIISGMLYSQEKQVHFVPTLNQQPIKLNTYHTISRNDSILFTQLRFYISHVQFFSKNKLVFEDTLGYYLIDISNPASSIIHMNLLRNKKLKYIRFNLGIDSITNSDGVHGGALDPTHGMYWTWQSGYINIKMEGIYYPDVGKRNPFNFHLGGFLYPNNALQTIQLIVKNKKQIQIQMPLDACITSAIASKKTNIMSPSSFAVQLSKIIAQSIRVQYVK